MTHMMSSLVALDRMYLNNRFEASLEFTWNAMLTKDANYTLFRWEDWPAWLTFTAAFLVLITLDNFVIFNNPSAMTMTKAILYTFFWIGMACAFCGWVYWYYGPSQAFMWMSGYMLEWMLSFDNLFVFHMIFTVYGTPDHLKHRPLFLGICGAVFFRLVFIFIGEYLMHAMFFMHFIFGAFLVYTGAQTVMADEEDDDPSQHPLVQLLQRRVPFIPAYDEGGRFFVRVPVDEQGEAVLPSGLANQTAKRQGGSSETDCLLSAESGMPKEQAYGTIDFAAVNSQSAGRRKGQLRATMLFLVVCCLEISDLLFAVDSVSAIVAQVNDLFLAYTSAVFAMLGLRATFFIIDVLAQLFSLLKYGVGSVLVFIGVKLILSHYYHIPPSVVCMVLVTCIGASMVASVIKDDLAKKAAAKSKGCPSPAAAVLAAKIKENAMMSPAQSPLMQVRGLA